jgi:predicted dinucleotide-binding enzyme
MGRARARLGASMKIAVIGTGKIGGTLGGRWRAAEELITAVGLEPVFAGDADASRTVDALLPLWFALVKRAGGNRRVALRIVQ